MKVSVVPLVCEVHVVPPFVVLRIVPSSPTAVPVFVSVNETPYRIFVVPLVCEVHVVPPFVVLRIIPILYPHQQQFPYLHQ